MECNNKHCLWNAFDSCCHEDPEKADKHATPNQLDCPVSLRGDFTRQLYALLHECETMLDRRNMKELMQVRDFMKAQRKKQ